MRKKLLKNHRETSAGKLVAGILVGGVVGATVGWLTAPASGAETRRRLMDDMKSAGEKIKTSEGNIESHVRDLAEAVGENPAFSRPPTTST
jgi:gas vesicle protein